MKGKILIANRGEIALRIMRACQELGLDYVVVYTAADKDSEHVQLNRDTTGSRKIHRKDPAPIDPCSHIGPHSGS